MEERIGLIGPPNLPEQHEPPPTIGGIIQPLGRIGTSHTQNLGALLAIDGYLWPQEFSKTHFSVGSGIREKSADTIINPERKVEMTELETLCK